MRDAKHSFELGAFGITQRSGVCQRPVPAVNVYTRNAKLIRFPDLSDRKLYIAATGRQAVSRISPDLACQGRQFKRRPEGRVKYVSEIDQLTPCGMPLQRRRKVVISPLNQPHYRLRHTRNSENTAKLPATWQIGQACSPIRRPIIVILATRVWERLSELPLAHYNRASALQH